MRPSEGPLVTAGDQRADATRAEALRWHWVRERWHEDRSPAWLRGTGPPERYHTQDETLLEGMRQVRLSTLEGVTR